jgi:hypothetical protein
VRCGETVGHFRKFYLLDAERVAPEHITDLIAAGRDISSEFSRVSATEAKIAVNAAAATDFSDSGQAMMQMANTSMPAWTRLSARLHVDQCGLLAASGTSTASAPTVPGVAAPSTVPAIPTVPPETPPPPAQPVPAAPTPPRPRCRPRRHRRSSPAARRRSWPGCAARPSTTA